MAELERAADCCSAERQADCCAPGEKDACCGDGECRCGAGERTGEVREQVRAGVRNVEFIKGFIEAVPLPDASVDVVISNCVLNLSGEGARVTHRVHERAGAAIIRASKPSPA